ncbi:MAG: hypothetical protein NZ572_00640 [Thermoflexus sp.]|nr:hypothetical protein [Thermoflexus sp.]
MAQPSRAGRKADERRRRTHRPSGQSLPSQRGRPGPIGLPSAAPVGPLTARRNVLERRGFSIQLKHPFGTLSANEKLILASATLQAIR